jgi:hypothetical protein
MSFRKVRHDIVELRKIWTVSAIIDGQPLGGPAGFSCLLAASIGPTLPTKTPFYRGVVNFIFLSLEPR